MIRLMSFMAIVLIVDIVFLGPLGVSIADIPLRRVLIALLILSSVVSLFEQKLAVTWPIAFFVTVGLFLIVWGGIVPQVHGVRLRMTLAEVQPFVALLLVLPFYQLFRYRGAAFFLKIIQRCVVVMAVIVIVVWAASNVFGNPSVGMAMREFYISMNDSDLGVYIGPLADGSFRVMLINFIIFPILLCYHNWRRTDLGWSVFYALAIFATGTRSFLGVWALIVGVSMLRKRPVLAVPIIVIVAGGAFFYIGSMQRLRVFEFSSDFQSTSARFVQYFSLMDLFWQHPIFGSGLGANAAIIRSVDAPYSYELTYVALLAKLGVIGSGFILAALTIWILRLMKATPNWLSILSLVAAIFLMTSTNPYLINLVGLTILAFIIALGAYTIERSRPSTGYRPLPLDGVRT